jgi:very-short-patch-repair endonuclease
MTGTLHSQSEKFFLDVLESIYSIKIERQFMLGSRFYDGRFGTHLIEVDGLHWHSRPEDKRRDALKDRIAQKYGFQLHRIRLNRTADVPNALEQHKQVLDEIFNGSSKPKIPAPARAK